MLRRRIFTLRVVHGLSLRKIARAVGLAHSTVHHHLRAARLEAYKAAGDAPKENLGHVLLVLDHLQAVLFEEVEQAPEGSEHRLRACEQLAGLTRQRTQLLLETGLIPRVPSRGRPPRDEWEREAARQARRIRMMGAAELAAEVQAIRAELAAEDSPSPP